ncbi:MAG: Rpn family recombination-promoting nuclease/putative transposase [Pseudomonadota bacterium]
MTTKIHQPHDKLFRNAMQYLPVAKDFFCQFLPKAVLNQIDLETLVFCKDTFVDNELKKSQVDVLYRAKLNHKNQSVYLYILVEHQSTEDELIALRLLEYQTKIMRYHLSQTRQKCLPIIYPLVFYTGEKKLASSIDLFDLFKEQKDLAKSLMFSPYRLIDVKQLSDEDLIAYQWAGALSFIYKHRALGDFVTHFQTLLQILKGIPNEGENYIFSMLKYISNEIKFNDTKIAYEQIQNELSGMRSIKMGTIAELFFEDGKQEGLQLGKQEGLQLGKQEGLQLGKQEGLQLGKKEGLVLGMEKQSIAVAKKCIAMQLAMEQIMKISGLSRQKIIALQTQMST